ncbi:MAG: SDR family NAD(P)-dependent oxidoreductase [Acidimicrobiia bacterium]
MPTDESTDDQSHDHPVLELFRLDGRVALVTGGSKGLGFAIARSLAQAGADLVVASRSRAELQEAARALAIDTGRSITSKVCDVRQDDDVARLVDGTVDTFGRIDIVVNSAGINIRKPAVDLSVAEFENLLDVNLSGTFRVCKAAAPYLISQKAGCIINLSSMLDRVGIQGRTGYAASKGGVLMLTRTLALELADHGVRANAISPGPFATPLNRVLLSDPQARRDLLAKVPLGRWGRPYEVGAAAVYLASPAADFVTGTTLYIDGGWTSQ